MAASLNWWEDEEQIAAYLQEREVPVETAQQSEVSRPTDVDLALRPELPEQALQEPTETATPWWQDTTQLAAYQEDLRSIGRAATSAGSVDARIQRGLVDEFSAGLSRGVDQTQALGYGLLGLMGESLGVEAVSNFGIEGYVRNMEEAAENMASVQDPFEEIGGVGDAGLYAAGVLGEQIPQLLLSLAGGGIGGYAAKTVAKKVVANEIAKRVTAGMAKEEAEEVVAKLVAQKALQGFATQAETQAIQQAATRGALGGAYVANVGQIAGGSFGEIEQETGLRDPVNALGFALLGGALETGAEALMLAPVASKLIGRPSTSGLLSGRGVENAAAGMAVGPGTQTALRLAATPPTEGLTEYGQTFTEQAAVAAADPNRTLAEVAFTPEAERERQIAGAAGVVAGGGFAAASQAASYLIPETAKAVQAKLAQRQANQGQQEQEGAQQRIEAEGSTWSEPQTLQGYTFRQNERGQLAVFNPDPEEFKGLPQFSTPDGQTFVPLFGVEDSLLPQNAVGLAFKARSLFDADQTEITTPATTVKRQAQTKPATETVLEDGPDLTPAAQAVGARARFSGYEGSIAQDGARFLLRADDGTEVEVPGDGEVEIVPAPEPTRLTTLPIPAVQTPAATEPETPSAQPEPLPDMAAMGAEEISRAALARPEVEIIDRAAETPDAMDANAVSLLRDARTTLEESINEIESRDIDAETKTKLTTPLYEKFIKADDTLGKVPADATTQLDREIERKRQEAEQVNVERAKVAAQTINRPPAQSEQFVNSLKQGDGVTIYLSGDQAPDALSFNGRFERKRNDGTVFVTTEPDAEGKTQRMAFRPSEYNRIGMLRPAPPKESPVESAVKSVLGPKPTKAKAERVLGTPYTQGEAQPVFLDDGLYQNPGKSNKVPAVVRYFDKPGEPGVKEVVTFGQWNGNKRSTPFVTVRQMSEGLDVPVPDADLQNLPQGVQVEPRVMKNGQTANVVTKVEYQGNVYRRGDTAYDFSVNGRTTGPGGFREIYLNSPERLARSERARRGKETSKAKAGPGAVQSMLDELDEADQFFVSDARARAAQFIDRRTDLDDEAKKMAADEADASIIEQIASRTKRGVPPVSDLALFKRFNNRMLDIFESNQENETEANVGRDVQEAARQISDELVADGQTPQEAKAAVDPIVARWQSYGSFSPIKTAMTKVQSAKKAAVRSGQNRRAAEADVAAGTVGQARRAMTPAERFNERTTDEAMAARERSASLTEEDRDLLRDFNAQEELSESDLQRVEDLLQYIQGNTPYDQIYPTQPAGSPTAARAGALPGQPGSTDRAGGQVAGRQPAGVGGVTESRGRGRNQAGRGRGRDRVGGTDGGQTGTVPGAAPVGSGRPGVGGTPNQRNASAARRAFLGSFIRNQDLVATLPEATVERIYQAVSTTLDALAATRGRRVVAAVQPNMADLLGMSVRDLVAGYREEFTSYQANRERVDAIRTNAEQAVRSRLFEGPQAALEFIAQDQERPAFMRLIAQTMLNQAKRFGIDLNNIAMQVGIFRRQPPTGAQSGPAVRALVEEVEGAFNVTTPDGVETFEFGEGIGMTRKQAGKAARARAYDVVTGQTRTSWAGVLGVNPLAETAAERYSAVLNLDNWHEANDIGLTMLHEISHIFSETKFEGRENLNAAEKAAIKGLESFRVRMLKAVARANGLEVPSGNNPADLARLSRRVDDLSNPNVAGADADRRLAYLVSPNETARGLMESPDFLQLAIEVGLGDTRKRQNAVELTGPLAEAWNDMTELEAGRKVDPTSPLGRAFKDAWSATFGALDGATEGYVKPPVGANPLAQELAALNEAADFIEEQVATRGLDGTTAERDALLQEFMASRNMVQGAETTDAVVDEDAVEDPVTMSRAVAPSQENIPGSRSRLLEGLANAPYETKLDYHQQINAALIDPETGNDTIADMLGMPSPVIETTGPSVYSPSPGVVEFNPADILSGFTSVEDATRYMILRGAFTNQNAVAGIDPQESGEKEAADFDLGRVPNEQEVRQIYALLAKPDDTAIFLNKSGFSVVKLGFDGSHTSDVWAGTINQLQNLLGTSAESFAANTVYHENEYDLSTNPADDEYGLKFQTAATRLSLGQTSAGRSPDLQARAAVRLRERLARINQAFADQGFGSPDAAPSRLLEDLGLVDQANENLRESRAVAREEIPFIYTQGGINRGNPARGPQSLRGIAEATTSNFRRDEGARSADQARARGFRRLVEYADTNGLRIAGPLFRRLFVNDRTEVAEPGAEHSVFGHAASGRVIKVTHPDFVNDGMVGAKGGAGDYFTSLLLSREIFNLDTRFEGIVDLGAPAPQVVTSQPWVRGRKATMREITGWLEREGFVRKGARKDVNLWTHPALGVDIYDAVPANVLMDEEGNLQWIDVDVIAKRPVADILSDLANARANLTESRALPAREQTAPAPAESRARGRVWRPITKTTPTGGKISQGGMFSVDELLPKQAGDAFRDSRAAIRADVSQIQELSRKLERQMRSLYKGQTPPLDTINTALGNLENPLNPQQLDEIERLRATRRPKQAELKRDQFLRENRKRFKEVTQPEALAQLPEELAETIREMSAHIESLSRRLPQEGLVNGDLAVTVDEALGTYLNRSYAIFDDPNWSGTVRRNAKVMDAARKYIRNSLVQSKVIDLIDDAKFEGRTLSKEEATAMANDSVTEDQVEGMLESYLAIGDESPTVEVLSGRIPGQKNLSMLIRRGNIAPEIQALWGRYEDPTVNYAKTVMKLSSLIANNQFLTELRDMGLEEGWLWSRENNPDDDRQPPGYVRISSDNNPTLAPIAGMYAHPMLAEGLFKMFPVGSTEEHYWWLRSAMKLTGISMAMKTVGSVASQIRNYLGNYLNLIAGGNLGLGDIASGDFARRFQNSTDLVLANTFNKYRNATRAEWRAKIDDYIRRGIVGESITTGLLEDLLTASRRAGSPDWGDYVWDKVSKPFKEVADFATRTYSAGDDWFKVMIYEAEQDKYRKAHPDWDDEQVKQKAAEIARDIHWTYSLAPAVVQDLKKFPFVAPFVTFTTEVIRTTVNMIKLARQEIMEGRATGNRELENIGWKRVRGMTTAAFLPAAVGTASMAMAGISGEDEEDLRRFLPDWQKNSQLLVFRKENGEVSFVDISFLDPYEYFKKPLVAFTRSLRNAESAEDILLGGTMAMVRQAVDPFTSEQIFAGAVFDVMRNQDAAGRQVYNPQDTGANIGTAVARKIFIEPFTPGTITSLDRIGKAAFGIQSESGRAYGLFNELASVMAGQRVSEMDAQQALQFKGSRFMRELRDASALFNREFVSQGTRSASDVVSGYERSNAARRALIEGIRNDYMAAIRLGVPVQRAKAILRDAGLGRETLKMVTTGIYRPFDASEQSIDLVRSRGKTDRITAYNQAKRNAPSREVLP